jgi:hypothetical protein
MRNLANKIEEFSKCDDFSDEISSAHRNECQRLVFWVGRHSRKFPVAYVWVCAAKTTTLDRSQKKLKSYFFGSEKEEKIYFTPREIAWS